MKQTTTKEKIDNGKSIIDHKAVAVLRDLLRPLLSLIASIQIPYKVVIEQPCHSFIDGPVIYAVNHFCFADVPIMGMTVPKRAYILVGKQRLGFFDWLYCILNGVIFIDRKDKADTAISKRAITAYLKEGRSVIIFPEGTWNLTECLLMMPMKWGIIDVAKESKTNIVPVILEYDRKHRICFIRFGDPLVFSQEDDNNEAITALRNVMATMRWMFWERNGVFNRHEMDIDVERQRLFYSVDEYPVIEWEYESSCIYHPYTEPQEAFAHLRQLIPCKENAFLFRERH